MKSKNDKDFNNKSSKVIKLSAMQNKVSSTKLKIALVVTILILLAILARIAWLQFVDGNHLKELAYSQQTINQIISPKRGNIYDSTGKVLATSAQVDTVTVNPKKIEADSEEATIALKEKLANI